MNQKYKNYSNELEKYKNQLDEIEKNQKYFKVDNECIKFNFKKIENTKNQNIDELLIDEDKKDPIIITKDNETKLYKWNKNSWKEEKLSNYSKLNYLCNFKDKKLENITYDELDCLYKSSYGCRSRRFLRAKKRYENYLKIVNELKENIDNIDNLQDNIEDNLESILKFVDKKYYVKQENSIENKINKNNKKSEQDEFGEYKKYIDLINQLEDEEYRNYIIFKLIENDGLLIGKDIYSKKYKTKTFCGHYYYLRKLENASNDELRVKLNDLLNSEFILSDNVVENEYKICKNCGRNIGEKINDEFMGFNTAGEVTKVQRELWYEKTDSDIILEKDLKKIYDQDIVIDCTDSKFLNELLSDDKKVLGSIDKVTNICNIIKDISNKMGFRLDYNDTKSIILDSLYEIQQIIIPFQNFI